MIVAIRALSVKDNQNGTFSIEFPDRPLTEEEQKVLRSLFPNLTERAYELLAQEAMLGSVATQEEELRPKKGKKNDPPTY